ncbi:hypothetical protein CAPTEDRAFT_207350 [Capitella teleta]|uniref:Sulfotransferase domain-containing protein n=1 Tax=Capitella teleta TaxID=283909 RepID=R7UL83_CAPTE|nr:hypothetical protein CAPTEDRAFT_207350 [Capitella teleta]|eukprot:ELU04553.1 hypothetical protein CAPTEDRAFT_207350 [Capitella teleta]
MSDAARRAVYLLPAVLACLTTGSLYVFYVNDKVSDLPSRDFSVLCASCGATSQAPSSDKEIRQADDAVVSHQYLHRRELVGNRSSCLNVSFSKRDLPSTALASYPGSGNTWTRHIIELLSVLETVPEYCELHDIHLCMFIGLMQNALDITGKKIEWCL